MRKSENTEDRGYVSGYWWSPAAGSSLEWAPGTSQSRDPALRRPVMGAKHLSAPEGIRIVSYPIASRHRALRDFVQLERVRSMAEHFNDQQFLAAALRHANAFGPLTELGETPALWWDECRQIADLYRMVSEVVTLSDSSRDDDHSALSRALRKVAPGVFVLHYGGSELSRPFNVATNEPLVNRLRTGLEEAIVEHLDGHLAVGVRKHRDIRYVPRTRLAALYLLLLIDLVGVAGPVRVCEYCHTEFEPKRRRDAKYCSDNCRAKAAYERKVKEVQQ
ncbi:MAG: hypothetical protein ACHQ0J_10450 [Candidatus Dormibacterales bacterium]